MKRNKIDISFFEAKQDVALLKIAQENGLSYVDVVKIYNNSIKNNPELGTIKLTETELFKQNILLLKK